MLLLKLAVFAVVAHAATFQPDGVPFKFPVATAAGLASSVVFSNLTTPRGIAFDTLGNLLVVEPKVGLRRTQAHTSIPLDRPHIPRFS